MSRFYRGGRKDKGSMTEATERLNKRITSVDMNIKELNQELLGLKNELKSRSGSAQDTIKARAKRILEQRKWYEGQRQMLYNQTLNLNQVSCTVEGLKDARHTMSAMKRGKKDLEEVMGSLNIKEINKLDYELTDYIEAASEIQESLGGKYGVSDDIDEDDLMKELEGLEAGMKEEEVGGVPSYVQAGNPPSASATQSSPPGTVNQAAGECLHFQPEVDCSCCSANLDSIFQCFS